MVINILSFCCAFLDVLESAAGTHINQLCSRNELPVNCGCTDSQGVLTGKTGPTHTDTQRGFWDSRCSFTFGNGILHL